MPSGCVCTLWKELVTMETADVSMCKEGRLLSIAREMNVIYETLQQNLLCPARMKKRVLQCSKI